MATNDREDLPPIPEIRRIGIIGAGQMGGGIAEVAALAGFEIRLVDVGQEQLDRTLERIGARLARRVDKSTLSPGERDAALERVATSTDYGVLAECQLVIEAATENEAVKRQIFAEAIKHLPADALIASNT
jgi:3-hydroxybutyryl-CoA dehydrogenase